MLGPGAVCREGECGGIIGSWRTEALAAWLRQPLHQNVLQNKQRRDVTRRRAG